MGSRALMAVKEAEKSLDLSAEQRDILRRFVLGSRKTGQAQPQQLPTVLSYLMRKVDVRRPETIRCEVNRELVTATFEIIRCKYLLENHFLTPAECFERIESVCTGISTTD